MWNKTKACKYCGSDFSAGVSYGEDQWKARQYCSRKCAGSARKGRTRERWGKAVKPIDCAHCGKTFTPRQYGPQTKYCTQVCYHASKSIPPRKCPWCGKLFRIPGSRQKYCSLACSRPAQTAAVRNLPREQRPWWKGGRHTDPSGYVHVALDDERFACMRSRNGYVLEHRLVMATHIGRPLLKNETVHHINGIRDDNSIENLQLHTGKHGSGAAFRCADCGSTNVIAVKLN